MACVVASSRHCEFPPGRLPSTVAGLHSQAVMSAVEAEISRFQLSEVLALVGADGGSGGCADSDSTRLAVLLKAEAPLRLLRGLPALDFEAQKDAVVAFEALLRLGGVGCPSFVEHVEARAAEFSELLAGGIREMEVAAHYGLMLRACARDVGITSALLDAGCASELLRLAGDSACLGIDVSLEVFASLRNLLLTQKTAAATYLEEHFATFFEQYHPLLFSEVYATRRQALRLLGDLLLDRSFCTVMVAYVSRERFLQIHMNLLRDASRPIQFEAFHIFKLFVASPHRPFRVQVILRRNGVRLTHLLAGLATSKGGSNIEDDVQVLTQAIESFGC